MQWNMWILLLFIFLFHSIFAQDFTFYPESKYNSEIKTPKEIIGLEIGQRPIRHTSSIWQKIHHVYCSMNPVKHMKIICYLML